MVLLTPDVSKGTESAAVKFSLLILSGVASIMCSARVIIFTCFIKKKKKTREESVYFFYCIYSLRDYLLCFTMV